MGLAFPQQKIHQKPTLNTDMWGIYAVLLYWTLAVVLGFAVWFAFTDSWG